MSDVDFAHALKRVVDGETLDAAASSRAFAEIMGGRVDDAGLAAFLTALAKRRPAIDEIVGAARAMRGTMLSVEAPAGAMDLCGTGGDGAGTLNISTACAFVVAGAGQPVAKHGNRNMSSRSGAADVLEALGVDIDMTPERAAQAMREAGVAFLFAQTYHPAMRHAAPVRRALGIRTIFNLLGPICSPARVDRQLVGVYSREWVVPLAHALRELGGAAAWVVHGNDGLDEVTTTTTTTVAALDGGKVSEFEISPEQFGIQRTSADALKGGSAKHNADALLRLLSGETGAYRDIVLLNSAAALVVGGRVTGLEQGLTMAAAALDSGRARQALDKLISVSRDAP